MLINCHSYFSLRYGAIKPEKLLEELSVRGYSDFALTDINNTSASIEFVRLAGKYNVRPVLGIDFRNGIEQKYVALARNNEGHPFCRNGLRLSLYVPYFSSIIFWVSLKLP